MAGKDRRHAPAPLAGLSSGKTIVANNDRQQGEDNVIHVNFGRKAEVAAESLAA